MKAVGKTTRKVKLRDDTARIVARIHGVSTSYVQKVRNGERDNEEILATLVEYTQGKHELIQALERTIQKHSNHLQHARKAN
jgi:hypothetical protein